MKTNFSIGKSNKKIWKEKQIVIKEIGNNNELMVFVLKKLEQYGNKKYIPNILSFNNKIYKYKFIKGKSLNEVKELSTRNIKKIALMMKKIHNSMLSFLSFEELQKNTFYLHNDLNPMNFIFRFNRIKSIIDWDGISKGDIKNDLYYLMWTCINLGEKHPKKPKIKLKKIKKFIGVYGYNEYIFSNIAENFKEIMNNRLQKAKIENHENFLNIKEWVCDSINFINKNTFFISNIELKIKKDKNYEWKRKFFKFFKKN